MSAGETTGQGTENQILTLDWIKWQHEKTSREREIELKAREQARADDDLRFRMEQERRSRWTNPLVIAVLGAAIAGAGNAGISWFNASKQREIENARAESSRTIQQSTAESNLHVELIRSEESFILEALKTNGDSDKAAANLQLLLDLRVLVSKEIADPLRTYLSNRPGGAGVALTSPTNH